MPEEAEPQRTTEPASESRPTDASYLFRATTPDGKATVDRVNAGSARDALLRLKADGYTDVQLLTDDSERSMPRAVPPERRLAPAHEARIRTLGPLIGWLYVTWVRYKAMFIVALLSAGFLIQRRLTDRPLNAIDSLLCVGLIGPIALTFVNWRMGPSRIHRMIELAYIDGRFERVLELVAEFESSATKWATAQPAFIEYEAAQWRSRAIAKLRGIDEALKAIEPLRNEQVFKPIQYWMARLIVCGAAFDTEGGIDAARICTEIEPDNPFGWVALVETYARDMDKPTEARECLRQLQTLPMNASLQQAVRYAEAMVLLSEGRSADAKSGFLEYLPIAMKRSRQTPSAQLLLANLHALLALACSRLGEPSDAARYFKEAQPILERNRSHRMLARCKRELFGQ